QGSFDLSERVGIYYSLMVWFPAGYDRRARRRTAVPRSTLLSTRRRGDRLNMVRRTSPLVLLGTLAGGVVLGVLLDRSGPFVSAQQAAGGARGVETATSQPAQAGRRAESPRATSEADLYEKLARQYEQFEHVNRTFELVAQAVSPAVVHIVAQKSSRSGD